jgi:hypothetical protein
LGKLDLSLVTMFSTDAVSADHISAKVACLARTTADGKYT